MTQDINRAAIAQPEPPTQAGGALAMDSAFDAWPRIIDALAATAAANPRINPPELARGPHGHYAPRSVPADHGE